ncbi:unnamed protein product [Brachionus calyciflorus]|uniref:Uncharacterized protein n=1 Tax=Brachionus calyciflorus TaxID=104777 RepID=A0A813NLA4_9BILA|nr:unnamed protein product [Brachionus calyciflorus]
MSLKKEIFNKISIPKNKNDFLSIIRQELTGSYKLRSDLWRHEIYLELIFDLVNFSLSKGFREEQLLACSDLFENSIDLIRKPPFKLINLVDYLTDNLKKLSPLLNDQNLKRFIDFLEETILTHFNLYKFVFCFEKDDNTISENKIFYSPNKDSYETNFVAKPYNVWLYDQKINLFDKKEEEIKLKFQYKREQLLNAEENATQLINFVKNDAFGEEKPLDDETMKKMIDHFSNPTLKITKQILEIDLEEVCYKIENLRKKQSFINSEEHQQKGKEAVSVTPKTKKK